MFRDIEYNFGRNKSSGIKIRIYSRGEEESTPSPTTMPTTTPDVTSQSTHRFYKPSETSYQQPVDLTFSPTPPESVREVPQQQGQGKVFHYLHILVTLLQLPTFRPSLT